MKFLFLKIAIKWSYKDGFIYIFWLQSFCISVFFFLLAFSRPMLLLVFLHQFGLVTQVFMEWIFAGYKLSPGTIEMKI